MLVAGVGGMGDYRAGVGCDMLVAGGWRGRLPGDCCDMVVAGGGREVIFVAWIIFLNLWSKTLMA